VERLLELDAMLGTLDFVAQTDWVTILPAIMMADEPRRRQFAVNRIVDPAFELDLVLIEPSRRAMSLAAAAFFAVLEEETARLNQRWSAGSQSPGSV
jgi:LysR family transcriptional regulator, nitrogen assimilation regulatory protein